jgi:hypothetical protein
MTKDQVLCLERRRDFSSDARQSNSSSTIPTMQRDHDTIRQVSSYLVPVEVFGSHSCLGANKRYEGSKVEQSTSLDPPNSGTAT